MHVHSYYSSPHSFFPPFSQFTFLLILINSSLLCYSIFFFYTYLLLFPLILSLPIPGSPTSSYLSFPLLFFCNCFISLYVPICSSPTFNHTFTLPFLTSLPLPLSLPRFPRLSDLTLAGTNILGGVSARP